MRWCAEQTEGNVANSRQTDHCDTYLGIGIDEVLEIVVFPEDRLRNDILEMQTGDGYGISRVDIGQPGHFLRFAVIAIVQI